MTASTSEIAKERVIAYIDGYNLYFGLCDRGWRRYLWLDIRAFAASLLKPTQELVAVKYFTTRVGKPPDSVRRQGVFLDALEARGGIEIIYGNFIYNPIECDGCGHTWKRREEKQTDVAIATNMLMDAVRDRFDAALLVCADTDQVPVVRMIENEHANKRVIVAAPPRRHAEELRGAASAYFNLGRSAFRDNQLPMTVPGKNGYALAQPVEWWSEDDPDD